METQTFEITWKTQVEATDPVEAARRAFDQLRYHSRRPTRFIVARWRKIGPYREGYWLPVELDTKNPLGRPAARIEDGAVLCGHCGSDNTRYIEDVSQHAPFTVRDGVPYCSAADLEIDEEGADPRVWCFGCGRESALPDTFAWESNEEPPCADGALPADTAEV